MTEISLKIDFSNNMSSSAIRDLMAPTGHSEMREAAERNVLAYITAMLYEQNPRQWMLERGLTFSPLVPESFTSEDPAALSSGIAVDYDGDSPSVTNANALAQMSGEYLLLHREIL